MKRFKIFLIWLFFSLSFNAYGQAVNSSPESKGDSVEIGKGELKNVDVIDTVIGIDIRRMIAPRIINLTPRDKELIAMHPQDRRKYTAILEKEEIRYVRLHDLGNCSEKNVIINANEPCPWNILGKAASYSFRKGKYQRAYFSDIRIRNSVIEVVGANLLGFLAKIGDIDLNALTLQSDGIREMVAFQPSSDVKEADKTYLTAKRGFKINDFFYKTALPIKEDTTYALRAVAFDGKIYRKGAGGFRVNLLQNDKRRDVTIAFRVIRKHDDGSYGILWKELQRKPAPKLKGDKQIMK